MILLMCSRKSAFSSLARIEGFVVMPDGKPRSSASSISSRFAESTKIFMVSLSGPGPSLRDGPVVVSAVTCLREQPAPAGRIEVGSRGELPALELLPLRAVQPGIHLHVAVPAVALTAVAVEVLAGEPARDLALGRHRGGPRRDVARGARVAVEEIDLTHGGALRRRQESR